MARNRQKAKKRQAERAKQGGAAKPPRSGINATPPEELGRSDRTLAAADSLDEVFAHTPLEDPPDKSATAAESTSPTTQPSAASASAEKNKAMPKEKKPKEEKPSIFARFLTFCRGSAEELKKTEWPNRQQTTTLTGVVIAFVIMAGSYLGALDQIFSRIVGLLL